MYGEKIVQQGFWIYQWSCCFQKSNMVFSRQQTAHPLVTASVQHIKNCEAQNFDITGASIDETNPAHHMVLRRSRRKVKLQSKTGSIQETVEHEEDSSSESMESGFKQGNPIYTMDRDVFPHILFNMKIYFWNCCGLGMLTKRQAIKKMLIHHVIDVSFLLNI